MVPQLGNTIEISRSYKTSGNGSKSNDLAAQKLGQNPSISLKPAYTPGQTDLWSDGKMISTPSLSVRQLFPGTNIFTTLNYKIFNIKT